MTSVHMKKLFLTLLTAAVVQAMKRSSTVIQKSNVEDLQSSGSGYSYQISSGDPFTFKNYENEMKGEIFLVK